MEFNLEIDGRAEALAVDRTEDGSLAVTLDGRRRDVRCRRIGTHHLHLTVDGRGVNAYVQGGAAEKAILIDGAAYRVGDADARARKAGGGAGAAVQPREVTPPMPSAVVKVLVAPGQAVRRGQPLVVVTAMKMEITLTAAFPAVVTAVNAAEGDQVKPGDILVDLAERADDASAAD